MIKIHKNMQINFLKIQLNQVECEIFEKFNFKVLEDFFFLKIFRFFEKIFWVRRVTNVVRRFAARCR